AVVPGVFDQQEAGGEQAEQQQVEVPQGEQAGELEEAGDGERTGGVQPDGTTRRVELEEHRVQAVSLRGRGYARRPDAVRQPRAEHRTLPSPPETDTDAHLA